jgi:hypothetical protein
VVPVSSYGRATRQRHVADGASHRAVDAPSKLGVSFSVKVPVG